MTDETKQELLEREIVGDEDLIASEKETTFAFPNDKDMGYFHSDVTTMVKWFLSVEGTEVNNVRMNERGEIIGIQGRIPKSIVKLQGNSRKSNEHSDMVSYGPNV